MLPRENRLKLPVKWDRYHPELQFRSHLFKVIAKRTSNTLPAKVGFLITTKVGKAVLRNELKRKLSALLRTRLSSLPVGLEMIWIVHPELAKAKDEEIVATVDKALSTFSV
jgi:ribonuclease P protein component